MLSYVKHNLLSNYIDNNYFHQPFIRPFNGTCSSCGTSQHGSDSGQFLDDIDPQSPLVENIQNKNLTLYLFVFSDPKNIKNHHQITLDRTHPCCRTFLILNTKDYNEDNDKKRQRTAHRSDFRRTKLFYDIFNVFRAAGLRICQKKICWPALGGIRRWSISNFSVISFKFFIRQVSFTDYKCVMKNIFNFLEAVKGRSN